MENLKNIVVGTLILVLIAFVLYLLFVYTGIAFFISVVIGGLLCYGIVTDLCKEDPERN